MKKILTFTAALIVSCSSFADIQMPSIFGNHMVLQQGMDLPVWGTATPGSTVKVEFAGTETSATTGADGNWHLNLKPVSDTDKTYTMTVSGEGVSKTFNDILLGEVWLGSGQSNMEWPVRRTNDAKNEISHATHPKIRLYNVPKNKSFVPLKDIKTAWQVCTPETIPGFSAVLYFFGRALQMELNVPVGLINSAWGGTRIEPWTPPCGFETVPELQTIADSIAKATPGSESYTKAVTAHLNQMGTWLQTEKENLAVGKAITPAPVTSKEFLPFTSHQQPTMLYNAMIHPFVPYAIKGAIWYQGESNHREDNYAEKTQALVKGWRKVWNQGAFPFYYVQIAPYQYGNENSSILPKFWQQQTKIMDVLENTGMAIVSDVGNIKNIHPRNKQECGRRLALWALSKDYGKNVVFSGPLFDSMKLQDNKLIVTFKHADGLTTRDGKAPSHFEIIGENSGFEDADAEIQGNSIILSSPAVKKPVAVRFAWHKTAVANLMNGAGLPANSFQAGEIPANDFLKSNVKEAKDYKLIYDADLTKLSGNIPYTVNNSKEKLPFSRIAYCLEFGDSESGENMQAVYVSMDAFTDDLAKIGIPVFSTKARFQQTVKNLHIFSTNATLAGEVPVGNIEFWPNNYSMGNKARVPGAANNKYDWGDKFQTTIPDGYGSMQIHNFKAKTTIFALNNFKAGNNADCGIGNNPDTKGQPDWTFSKSAAKYPFKRLRVLVLPK